MQRHGGKTVFFGRFVTVLRYTAAWVAGLGRMPWWRFLFWNALGGVAWATARRAARVLRGAGGGRRDPALRPLRGGLRRGVVRGRSPRAPPRPAVGRGADLDAALLALALVRSPAGVRRQRSPATATTGTSRPPSARLPRFTHVLSSCSRTARRRRRGQPRRADVPTARRRYATLTDYEAVTHPSLPNYLALVSGSTQGITTDCTGCIVRARSLADTLAAAGRSWKTYAEDLPEPGWTGASAGATRRSTTRSSTSGTSRLAVPPPHRRPVPPPGPRRRAARAARLLAPRPGSLPRHARLLGRDRRRLAARARRAAAPLARTAGRRRLRRLRRGNHGQGGGGAVEALALGPTVRPAPSSRSRRTTTGCCGRSRTHGACRGSALGERDPDRRNLEVGVRRSRGNPVRACWPRSPGHSRSATRRYGHGARVAALAEPVAVRLGWDRERLRALRHAAPLHDIGKIKVRREVLGKPGPLTLEEVAEIRRHPRAGAQLVLPLRSARHALPYVLFHHECWDGSGYPAGLARRSIPIEARILAVADAFDAMISPRPYRRTLTTSRRSGSSSAVPAVSSTRSSPSSSSRPGPRAGTPGRRLKRCALQARRWCSARRRARSPARFARGACFSRRAARVPRERPVAACRPGPAALASARP